MQHGLCTLAFVFKKDSRLDQWLIEQEEGEAVNIHVVTFLFVSSTYATQGLP